MSETYEATVDIDAPADAVWAVLVDLPRYREWNPFTPRIDGRAEVGASVRIHADMGRFVFPQSDRVLTVEPGRELAWGMSWGPLLRATRRQILTPRGSGCTYRTTETMDGPLAPLVRRVVGARVQAGFVALSSALKQRAEAR